MLSPRVSGGGKETEGRGGVIHSRLAANNIGNRYS